MPSPPAILPLDQFRDRLGHELDAFMGDATAAAAHVDPLFEELLATFREYMSRPGKRLRPYLMYVAYLGYGGDNVAAIIRASLSQELYHNAWLIHDDIIDRDLIRHGGLNIAGTYRRELARRRVPDREHLATSAALVTGDLALALASELILAAPFAAEHRIAAARRLHEISFGEVGGEITDVLLPSVPLSTISTDRLLRVYYYKTAAYSFELPLQTGAILAGAPAAELAAISRLAGPWGTAFQITDDLLGTFVGEQQLGKSVLSDLREGKRTILYLNGLKLADAAGRKRLRELAGNPKAGYSHLAQVRTILEQSGARARTAALAETFTSEAVAALDQLLCRPDAAAIFRRLIDFSAKRQH